MESPLHHLRPKAAHVATSFNSNANKRPKYALMLLFPFFAILVQAPFVAVRGQSITLTVVNPDTICLSPDLTPLIIGFRATGYNNVNNAFNVQLSNASGSFTNPTTIGHRANDNGPEVALIANIPGNLAAGNGYFIRVVSTQPVRTSTTTRRLVIHNAPAPSLTISQQDVSGCHGGSDGIITGTATGGTGPYQFNLLGGGVGTDSTIEDGLMVSNLPPGDKYVMQVTDAGGCFAEQNVGLVQIPVPTIEVSTLGNESACGAGGDGFFTIRVFPRDGTIATAIKPYTWKLDDALYTPVSEQGAAFKFPNLAQGTYTLSMTDGAGCASTDTLTDIVIGKDKPLGIVLSGWGNPTTCGGTNGDITVLDTGGSHSTYRYSISKDGGSFSDPQSGRRFGGLTAGTYTIEGRDSRGCTATLVKTLNDPKGCSLAVTGSIDDLNLSAKNALGLQVFPNPTRTSFTLNLQSSSKENVQIIVTDMVGKKIYQTTGSGSQQFTFGSEFSSGMYIVQVIQGKQIQTLKLVKGN